MRLIQGIAESQVFENRLDFGWRLEFGLQPEFGRGRLSNRYLMALVASLLLCTVTAQAKNSGPKLVVSEYRHTFGDIFAGQFVDYAFTIRNEGTAPLMLSEDVRHAPISSALSGPGRAGFPRLSTGSLQALASLTPLNGAKGYRGAGLGLDGPTGWLDGLPEEIGVAPT